MAPKTTSEPAFLAVTESFMNEDGELFRTGEVVEADHPEVKKGPSRFGPLRLLHPIPRARPALSTPEIRAE